MMEIKKMMTIRQAAEVFGLTAYAIRQLALNGAIPATRIGTNTKRGGKILVNAAGLENYLAAARLNCYDGAATGITEIGAVRAVSE
jgi:excisionase family DNA binding protein